MPRTWLQAGALALLAWVYIVTSSGGQTSYAAETASLVAPQIAGRAGGSTSPSIKVYNGDPAMESLILWGLQQFHAAGLSFPRVSSVTFLVDAARCQGYIGWIEPGPDGPEVTLCFHSDDACVDANCHEWRLPYKIAVLHEFSHAWLSQNGSDRQETEFMRFEELQSWQDFSVDWFQRGVERAAIAMARALSAEPLPQTLAECVRWAEGFRILTGAGPLAPCGESGTTALDWAAGEIR